MKKQKLTKPHKNNKDTKSSTTIANKTSIDYRLPHSCDENCKKFECINDPYHIMDYSPSNSIYSPGEPIENILFNVSSYLYVSFQKAYKHKYTVDKKDCEPQWQATINKENKEKNSVLVLDLDQTLVHTNSYSKIFNKENVDAEITSENFAKQQLDFVLVGFMVKKNVTTRFRPYLEHFLEVASTYFDLAIYTSAHQGYAEVVVDYLATKFKICHRLYRPNCYLEGVVIKDLDYFIEAYDNVYFIDNDPVTFSYNIEHGIYIENWYGDEKDIELKKLAELLPIIHRDGKETVKKYMRTEEILMLWKDSKRPPNKDIKKDYITYNEYIQLLLNKKNDK